MIPKQLSTRIHSSERKIIRTFAKNLQNHLLTRQLEQISKASEDYEKIHRGTGDSMTTKPFLMSRFFFEILYVIYDG